VLSVGIAAVVSGCAGTDSAAHARSVSAPTAPLPTATSPPPPSTFPPATGPRILLDAIPPPHPGPAHQVSHARTATQQIALTIDDGTCGPCVDGYVALAVRTGIHLTFSPNGIVQEFWNPHAETLRGLIERGQVQIGNHTYSHKDLREMSDANVRSELERNDDWVTRTFGITTRPWYRPPFGNHNDHVDGIAGSLGYRNVLLWNGTLSDSTSIPPDVLMSFATRYLQPGTVVLGHANHPTVLGLFDEIIDLIRTRQLEPVTLDEMFGTSRAVG
jgi:peptidoglycan-N-acetylglucosamine deacetylase